MGLIRIVNDLVFFSLCYFLCVETEFQIWVIYFDPPSCNFEGFFLFFLKHWRLFWMDLKAQPGCGFGSVWYSDLSSGLGSGWGSVCLFADIQESLHFLHNWKSPILSTNEGFKKGPRPHLGLKPHKHLNNVFLSWLRINPKLEYKHNLTICQ